MEAGISRPISKVEKDLCSRHVQGTSLIREKEITSVVL